MDFQANFMDADDYPQHDSTIGLITDIEASVADFSEHPDDDENRSMTRLLLTRCEEPELAFKGLQSHHVVKQRNSPSGPFVVKESKLSRLSYDVSKYSPESSADQHQLHGSGTVKDKSEMRKISFDFSEGRWKYAAKIQSKASVSPKQTQDLRYLFDSPDERLRQMAEIKRKVFAESLTVSNVSDTLTSFVIQSPLDTSQECADLHQHSYSRHESRTLYSNSRSLRQDNQYFNPFHDQRSSILDRSDSPYTPTGFANQTKLNLREFDYNRIVPLDSRNESSAQISLPLNQTIKASAISSATSSNFDSKVGRSGLLDSTALQKEAISSFCNQEQRMRLSQQNAVAGGVSRAAHSSDDNIKRKQQKERPDPDISTSSMLFAPNNRYREVKAAIYGGNNYLLREQTGKVVNRLASLSAKQVRAAKKILRFLCLCRRVRIAYENRFRELLLLSVVRLQRAFRRMRLGLRAKKQGIYRATLYLDTRSLNLGQICQVEVFGEFSSVGSSEAWGLKIPCELVRGDEMVYSVNLDIKIGQKFKFIIDDGRAYATSSLYMQTKDHAGNLNNVFQFHSRVKESDQLVQNPESGSLRYPKFSIALEKKRSAQSLPAEIISDKSDVTTLTNGLADKKGTENFGEKDMDIMGRMPKSDTNFLQALQQTNVFQYRSTAQTNYRSSQTFAAPGTNLFAEDVNFQEYSTIASCSFSSPPSGGPESSPENALKAHTCEGAAPSKTLTLAEIKQEAKLRQALSAQFNSSLLLESNTLLMAENDQEMCEQVTSTAARFKLNLQLLQEDPTIAGLTASSEEKIRSHVTQANSFCMLRPSSPPMKLQLSPNSTGSAIDSRGDYPLSGRSSTITKNRFSFQTFGTFGNGVELSDTGSVNDEFSWATGPDGLHKHVSSGSTPEPLSIVSESFTIGKAEDSNEDAYFISERSFGIADGVSGWVEFGFSSAAFSNALMQNCKAEVELFDRQRQRMVEDKQTSRRMRKNTSFMSLEMLDSASALGAAPQTAQPSPTKQNMIQIGSPSKVPSSNQSNSSKSETGQCKVATLDTTYILEQAAQRIYAVGSATAVVGILNPKNTLQVCNLGDSGFLHYRQRTCSTIPKAGSLMEQVIGGTSLRARSKCQTHSFNIPYQMTQLPDEDQIEGLRQRGKISELMHLRKMLRQDKEKKAVCNDKPADADKYDVKLELGDVVVTATDGVFDNLFNREILDIIEGFKRERYALKKQFRCGLRGPPCLLSEPEEAKELARRICRASRAKVDQGETGKRVETPYQRKFKKTYNSQWDGGKEDDITVVVTFAVLESSR